MASHHQNHSTTTGLGRQRTRSNRAAVGVPRKNAVMEALANSRGSTSTKGLLSQSLDLGTRSKKSFKATENPSHHTIEEEYIKNLQQQIYFLELETDYLRGQLKKNAETDPTNLLKENSALALEIKTLKHEVSLKGRELQEREHECQHIEKEFTIAMDTMKEKKDLYENEKKDLMDEIVHSKQQFDQQKYHNTKQDSMIKDFERETKSSAVMLHEAESRIQSLREEMQDGTNKFNLLRVQFEEKRTECIKLQTQVAELEEKIFSSKATAEEGLIKELKAEVKNLKYEMRHKDITVKQDRALKEKMADDCTALVKENASLAALGIELQKTLDLERHHTEENTSRKQSNLQELVSLRESDKQLRKELKYFQEQLEDEKIKHKELRTKLQSEEFNTTQADVSMTRMQEDLDRLEKIRLNQSDINSDLARDKVLLSDELEDLYSQLDRKDNEIDSLRHQLDDSRSQCRDMTGKLRMQGAIDTIKWDEMEKIADTMKSFSLQMAPLHRSQEFD